MDRSAHNRRIRCQRWADFRFKGVSGLDKSRPHLWWFWDFMSYIVWTPIAEKGRFP